MVNKTFKITILLFLSLGIVKITEDGMIKTIYKKNAFRVDRTKNKQLLFTGKY